MAADTPTSSPVRVGRNGDIAWVTIDNPPVNATSTAVRRGLMQAVADVQGARVAVLRCAGRTFVAGGDMSEFDRPPEQPLLPDVVQAIEDSETPFLALMHGNVLGGGLEIALACAWRIAARGTRFGLPEVNVGLVPGAGGSQRLPRLVGMETAVEMACHGRVLDAEELAERGGLDMVFDDPPEAAARRFVARLPERPVPASRRAPPGTGPDYFARLRAELGRKARGRKAPLHNLQALEWSLLPFERGQPKERALHLELRDSAESRALRHIFFAERAALRPEEIAGVERREIAHVAVVGGGLMGSGIAGACLLAGLEVSLLETGAETAAAARDRVIAILDGALRRGKTAPAERAAQEARLRVVTDHEALGGADLAVEAVFEDLEVKRALFRRLAPVLGPEAILATNTSYLDPRRIFEGIEAQERCLGLHFFSPAHVMRLVEVIRTPQTGRRALATAFGLVRRLGKIGVLAGICDGFIGNRMLSAYRRQADYLLADGAMPHEIDAAMRGFGMPMGPYELQDLTGLQIAWANRRRQAPHRPAEERYVPIADRLCEAGRLGQRSGRGWYRYEADARTPQRDPEVEQLIIRYRAEAGIRPREFSAEEIASRMVAVLVNEGALIVEEGVARTPDDVDVVKVHGYGFPRWRGGPMHHAGAVGRDVVAGVMADVVRQSPGSWKLSRLLAPPAGAGA